MMKNFFRKQSTVKPLGEVTQTLADKWSPKHRDKGWGYALAFITKQLGGKVFEIANTNSMLPLFDAGHLLYCEPVTKDTKLDIYDVCIYEDIPTRSLIVHRIIAFDVNGRVKFKGDNNLWADLWVPRERIKWRVLVISYAR